MPTATPPLAFRVFLAFLAHFHLSEFALTFMFNPRELGVRFHPTRGSMSLGQSQGGLPPDSLCEDEATILADCERVIAEFHDPEPLSMLRIGLSPCSPFSVTPELMRKTAGEARDARQRLVASSRQVPQLMNEEAKIDQAQRRLEAAADDLESALRRVPTG